MTDGDHRTAELDAVCRAYLSADPADRQRVAAMLAPLGRASARPIIRDGVRALAIVQAVFSVLVMVDVAMGSPWPHWVALWAASILALAVGVIFGWRR